MDPSRAPLALFVALLLTSCASATGRPSSLDARAAREPSTVEGSVSFETREPTPRGASAALGRRPARFVRIELLRDGEVVGRGATDAEGAFRIEAAGPDSVRVVASTSWQGHEIAVGPDAGGVRPQSFERPLPLPSGPIELVASELDEGGPAGAFHILDTMLRGAVAVREWTGELLPPCYAHWERGVTTEWSYYRGLRPSGRYVIELLGGEPGSQATTDTDEHDEEIVLHEFGHFVMDVLTSHSSTGGTHPTGVLVDPGLAWEEGRATWFAAAVQGRSIYRDTIGLEPTGRLRVDLDLEERGSGPRGVGSEEGVAEILWDLSDGDGRLPDRDGDGVALGAAGVLEAMRALGRDRSVFPSVATFLDFLVEDARVERLAMKRLIEVGGHPSSVYSDGHPPSYPLELAINDSVSGKIDSLSSPAPSGGEPRPGNGVDAVKVYRIHVSEPGFLEVTLQIYGSGRVADRQDLDLELRDIRAELLETSRGEGAHERVGRLVEPGHYVVYVRCGGSGNQVGFELSVRLHGAEGP